MPRRHRTENSLLAKIERAFDSAGQRTTSRARNSFANRLSIGIGDDAALFRPTRGCETILTCDWFLEGTHFLRGKHPADSVGWKCLARAISDIAAMGGAPRCFLLSLAIPETETGAWLDAFLRGLRRAAQHFDCVLAGGDTTKRDKILINVTVIGEMRKGRALRRDGARIGDLLFVSGRLGEAERGLQLIRKQRGMANRRDERLQKHLYPQPRWALGAWLAEKRLATAAMDLSDGLSSDLPRLCAASGVGARVDAAKLPVVLISPPGRSAQRHSETRQTHPHLDEALQLALHGGDDYELLFTVPRRKEMQIPPSFEGVPLISIGEITASRKIVLVGQNSKPHALKPGGWDPFR
jgi:thiamine-monophosphate kinase